MLTSLSLAHAATYPDRCSITSPQALSDPQTTSDTGTALFTSSFIQYAASHDVNASEAKIYLTKISSGGTIDWHLNPVQFSSSEHWLNISPASGSITSAVGTSQTLTISLAHHVVYGMAVGTYTATLPFVFSPENTIVTRRVVLHITNVDYSRISILGDSNVLGAEGVRSSMVFSNTQQQTPVAISNQTGAIFDWNLSFSPQVSDPPWLRDATASYPSLDTQIISGAIAIRLQSFYPNGPGLHVGTHICSATLNLYPLRTLVPGGSKVHSLSYPVTATIYPIDLMHIRLTPKGIHTSDLVTTISSKLDFSDVTFIDSDLFEVTNQIPSNTADMKLLSAPAWLEFVLQGAGGGNMKGATPPTYTLNPGVLNTIKMHPNYGQLVSLNTWKTTFPLIFSFNDAIVTRTVAFVFEPISDDAFVFNWGQSHAKTVVGSRTPSFDNGDGAVLMQLTNDSGMSMHWDVSVVAENNWLWGNTSGVINTGVSGNWLNLNLDSITSTCIQARDYPATVTVTLKNASGPQLYSKTWTHHYVLTVSEVNAATCKVTPTDIQASLVEHAQNIWFGHTPQTSVTLQNNSGVGMHYEVSFQNNSWVNAVSLLSGFIGTSQTLPLFFEMDSSKISSFTPGSYTTAAFIQFYQNFPDGRVDVVRRRVNFNLMINPISFDHDTLFAAEPNQQSILMLVGDPCRFNNGTELTTVSLHNQTGALINWQLTLSGGNWLRVSSTTGTLASNNTVILNLNLNQNAISTMPPPGGIINATMSVYKEGVSGGATHTLSYHLQINPIDASKIDLKPVISDQYFTMLQGSGNGAFSNGTTLTTLTLSNQNPTTLSWALSTDASWLVPVTGSGIINSNTSSSLKVQLVRSELDKLLPGEHASFATVHVSKTVPGGFSKTLTALYRVTVQQIDPSLFGLKVQSNRTSASGIQASNSYNYLDGTRLAVANQTNITSFTILNHSGISGVIFTPFLKYSDSNTGWITFASQTATGFDAIWNLSRINQLLPGIYTVDILVRFEKIIDGQDIIHMSDDQCPKARLTITIQEVDIDGPKLSLNLPSSIILGKQYNHSTYLFSGTSQQCVVTVKNDSGTDLSWKLLPLDQDWIYTHSVTSGSVTKNGGSASLVLQLDANKIDEVSGSDPTANFIVKFWVKNQPENPPLAIKSLSFPLRITPVDTSKFSAKLQDTATSVASGMQLSGSYLFPTGQNTNYLTLLNETSLTNIQWKLETPLTWLRSQPPSSGIIPGGVSPVQANLIVDSTYIDSHFIDQGLYQTEAVATFSIVIGGTEKILKKVHVPFVLQILPRANYVSLSPTVDALTTYTGIQSSSHYLQSGGYDTVVMSNTSTINLPFSVTIPDQVGLNWLSVGTTTNTASLTMNGSIPSAASVNAKIFLNKAVADTLTAGPSYSKQINFNLGGVLFSKKVFLTIMPVGLDCKVLPASLTALGVQGSNTYTFNGTNTSTSSLSITNNTGISIQWDLEGSLPSWITSSASSGIIQNQGSQAITLTISRSQASLLESGTHTASLRFSFKSSVTGQQITGLVDSVNLVYLVIDPIENYVAINPPIDPVYRAEGIQGSSRYQTVSSNSSMMITNGSSGTISWLAEAVSGTSDTNWLQLDRTSGSINVGATASIAFSVNVAEANKFLQQGTYTKKIRLWLNNALTTHTATLKINYPDLSSCTVNLVDQQTTLSKGSYRANSYPFKQGTYANFILKNNSGITLDWNMGNVSYDTASGNNQWVNASGSGSLNTATSVTASVSIHNSIASLMSPGTYRATVSFRFSGLVGGSVSSVVLQKSIQLSIIPTIENYQFTPDPSFQMEAQGTYASSNFKFTSNADGSTTVSLLNTSGATTTATLRIDYPGALSSDPKWLLITSPAFPSSIQTLGPNERLNILVNLNQTEASKLTASSSKYFATLSISLGPNLGNVVYNFALKVDPLLDYRVDPQSLLATGIYQSGNYTFTSSSNVSTTITLTNKSGAITNWTATIPSTVKWLNLTKTTGTLAVEETIKVVASINTGQANLLDVDLHQTIITFSFGSKTVTCNVSLRIDPSTKYIVTPTSFTATGAYGSNSFSVSSNGILTLTNQSGTAVVYHLESATSWLLIDNVSGTLADGTSRTAQLRIDPTLASLMAVNSYPTTATVVFPNKSIAVPLTLKIVQGTNVTVTPSDSLKATGEAFSGSYMFSGTDQYSILNKSGAPTTYTLEVNVDWLTVKGNTSGSIPDNDTYNVGFNLVTSKIDPLSQGSYLATVTFRTGTGLYQTRTVQLTLTPPVVDYDVTPKTQLSAQGQVGSGSYLWTTANGFTVINKSNVASTWSSKIEYTTSSIAQWLQISPTSGTLSAQQRTSSTLSINIANANQLSIGDYSAVIRYTFAPTATPSQTSEIIRNVQLSIRQDLSVIPSTPLTSQGVYGGTNWPLSNNGQFILRNLGTSSINWTLTPTYTPSQQNNWIQFSALSGSLAVNNSTTVTLTIDSSKVRLFSVGSYRADIDFRVGSSIIRRSVIVDISPSNSVSVQPTSIEAEGMPKSGFYPIVSSPSKFTINNATGAEIFWKVTKISDWLSLNITTGTLNLSGSSDLTPSIITEKADLLSTGTYSSSVAFTFHYGSLSNTAFTSITREVILNVKDLSKTYLIEPSTMIEGTGVYASGQYTLDSLRYTLTNNSASPVQWSSTVTYLPDIDTNTWLNIPVSGGPVNSGASSAISISINVSRANTLVVGTYQAFIDFKVGLSSIIRRTVQLKVTRGSTLLVDPSAGLTAAGIYGATNYPLSNSGNFLITNSTGAPLSFNVSTTYTQLTDPKWLSVSPSTGSLNTSNQLTVTAFIIQNQISSLVAGTYTASVNFVFTDGSTPIIIQRAVNLTITQSNAFKVNPDSTNPLVASGQFGGNNFPFTNGNTISIGNASGGQASWISSVEYNPLLKSGDEWLILSENSGSIGNFTTKTIQLSINASKSSALSATKHQAIINFVINGTKLTSLVNLIVNPDLSKLSIDPKILSASGLYASSTYPFDNGISSFNITNNSGANVKWTTSIIYSPQMIIGNEWVSLPDGQSDSGFITRVTPSIISSKASTLESGSYNAQIIFNFDTGTSISTSIILKIKPSENISVNPTAGISCTSLFSTGIYQWDSPGSFAISNQTGTTITYHVESDVSWVLPSTTTLRNLQSSSFIPSLSTPTLKSMDVGVYQSELSFKFRTTSGTMITELKRPLKLSVVSSEASSVLPESGLIASCNYHGQTYSFDNRSSFTLINESGASLTWSSTINNAPWVLLSKMGGTLTYPGSEIINAELAMSEVSKLQSGTYLASVSFVFGTKTINRNITLTINPIDDFYASPSEIKGYLFLDGDSINLSTNTIQLTNVTGEQISWATTIQYVSSTQLANAFSWIRLSQVSGTLDTEKQSAITLIIDSNALFFKEGIYIATISFNTRLSNGKQLSDSVKVSLTVGKISIMPLAPIFIHAPFTEDHPANYVYPQERSLTISNHSGAPFSCWVSSINYNPSMNSEQEWLLIPKDFSVENDGIGELDFELNPEHVYKMLPGVYYAIIQFSSNFGSFSRTVALVVDEPLVSPNLTIRGGDPLLVVINTSGASSNMSVAELQNSGKSVFKWNMVLEDLEVPAVIEFVPGTSMLEPGAIQSINAKFISSSTKLSPGSYRGTCAFYINDVRSITRDFELRVLSDTASMMTMDDCKGIHMLYRRDRPLTTYGRAYTLTNIGPSLLSWYTNLPSIMSIDHSRGYLGSGEKISITPFFNRTLASTDPGIYSGIFNIYNANEAYNNYQRPYELTIIRPAPHLVFDIQDPLEFAIYQDQNSEFTRTLIIRNLGGKSTRWKLESSVPWLSLSENNGTLTPHGMTSIKISTNRSIESLQLGIQRATLSLFEQLAYDKYIIRSTADVSLYVEQRISQNVDVNLIPLTSNTVQLWTLFDKTRTPVNYQTASLSNKGTSKIAWESSSNQNWLSMEPAHGILEANTSNTVLIMLNSDALTLSSGFHQAQLSFTVYELQKTTKSFTVTINVEQNPESFLLTSPSVQVIQYKVGDSIPSSIRYNLKNSGNRVLQWNFTNPEDWLYTYETSGILQPEETYTIYAMINPLISKFPIGRYVIPGFKWSDEIARPIIVEYTDLTDAFSEAHNFWTMFD